MLFNTRLISRLDVYIATHFYCKIRDGFHLNTNLYFQMHRLGGGVFLMLLASLTPNLSLATVADTGGGRTLLTQYYYYHNQSTFTDFCLLVNHSFSHQLSSEALHPSLYLNNLRCFRWLNILVFISIHSTCLLHLQTLLIHIISLVYRFMPISAIEIQ